MLLFPHHQKPNTLQFHTCIPTHTMGRSNQSPLFFFLCLAMAATMVLGQGTRVGFYLRTCPRVESVVRETVRKHFNANPAIAPGLLRMHFHDCFVLGCDASVLIDGPGTERTGLANGNLRGFEVVEDAKAQLEAECPGVVSCADILALAARDSVVVTNGPFWLVPTGRRDGGVSLASDTDNLPGFTESVEIQKRKFAEKGLDTRDLVALVGAHTIGTTACAFFSYRLYNFNNTGGPDPSISPSFLPQLRALCPENGDGTKRVALDNGGSDRFDTNYFTNLARKRGVLESDQMLWTDRSTRDVVESYLGITGFIRYSLEFTNSMIKMSNIDVKTGTNGEIRKVCSAFNLRSVTDDSQANLDVSI